MPLQVQDSGVNIQGVASRISGSGLARTRADQFHNDMKDPLPRTLFHRLQHESQDLIISKSEI